MCDALKHETQTCPATGHARGFDCVAWLFVGTESRGGFCDHPAIRTKCRSASTTSTTSTTAKAMIGIIAIALAGVAAVHFAPRSGVALWCTAAMNAALVLAEVRLEAEHPLRIVGPLVPMVAAYLDMLAPTSERGYSIARLVFALAFAAEFAGMFYAIWHEWPLPNIVVVVCLGIMAHAIAPKGVLKWLPF
jgi:hypothetical protein